MANKIIVVTGPHEGVGKTTLCANLAARYSQMRHQPVTLIDADGNQYAHEENFVLCRCGGSQTKPFCDGTHKTNGFTAMERAPKPEGQ